MDNKFESSLTRAQLKEAFFEESALAARYSYFAVMAEFEGKAELSQRFRDYAESSKQNAHGILDFLRVEKDPASDVPLPNTLAALDSVLQTEIQQGTELYGVRAKVAREEGYTDIASWFDTLEKLKTEHTKKLQGMRHE